MITHIVTLKTLFPPKSAEQADEAALDERLDAALSRYCGGDAVAEDACRKWLAFERRILADSSIAPASLLALADAIDEAKPEGCHLSSKASAFLTFRLLGLSSLPPVRAAVPQEGLPSLIEPPENARWACGLLPFSPKVRFTFRPGAPWLRGLMERLEQTAGAAPGSGWEIEFAELDCVPGHLTMPCGGTLADDAAATPALFEHAVTLADDYIAKHGPEELNGRMMFYEEGTAQLMRDLPGLSLREAANMAEKGRGFRNGNDAGAKLKELWFRHHGVCVDGPDPFFEYLHWANALRTPMLHAWALWFWALEAQRQGKVERSNG